MTWLWTVLHIQICLPAPPGVSNLSAIPSLVSCNLEVGFEQPSLTLALPPGDVCQHLKAFEAVPRVGVLFNTLNT